MVVFALEQRECFAAISVCVYVKEIRRTTAPANMITRAIENPPSRPADRGMSKEQPLSGARESVVTQETTLPYHPPPPRCTFAFARKLEILFYTVGTFVPNPLS